MLRTVYRKGSRKKRRRRVDTPEMLIVRWPPMAYTRKQAETAIADELRRRLEMSDDDLVREVVHGDAVAAGVSLIVFPPRQWGRRLDTLAARLSEQYSEGPAVPDMAERILRFFLSAAACFGCFPPRWNPAVVPADTESAAAVALSILGRLAAAYPEAAGRVVERQTAEARARLEAEGVEDPETRSRLAADLFRDGLPGYVRAVSLQVAESNLCEASETYRSVPTTRFPGGTRWGNDYAAFLFHALLFGASFVTTNPVLIKLAWDIDQTYWDARVDETIERFIDDGGDPAGDEAVGLVCTEITARVVAQNCRLLRSIFLLSGGADGYVSAQVSPRNHSDSLGMIREARSLYGTLENILGGIPNVVIKLPSTHAGLEAAKVLTGEGIGVTITLTFSCFQASAFAPVLQRGAALVSYIALMNGRMAYPVRDELKEAGVSGGAEAARWAGVEVARKCGRILYGGSVPSPPVRQAPPLRIDPGKVKIMIASLRIYEPDTWIPDISELWGIPLLTVFPNVRRTFDSISRPFDEASAGNETPDDAMETMAESEIFRQAWWLPGDDEALKPSRVLSLDEEDQEAVAAWPPVAQTLDQFIDLYDRMGEAVRGRIAKHPRVSGLMHDN